MITLKLTDFAVKEDFIVFDHGDNLISDMTLLSDEDNPGESCIFVNNDQCVFLATYRFDRNRAKQIHVK